MKKFKTTIITLGYIHHRYMKTRDGYILQRGKCEVVTHYIFWGKLKIKTEYRTEYDEPI